MVNCLQRSVGTLYYWWDLLHTSHGQITQLRKGLKGLSSEMIATGGPFRCRYHFHLHQVSEKSNMNMILKNSQSALGCKHLVRPGRLLEVESLAACEEAIHCQCIAGCCMGNYTNCMILQRSHTRLCQPLSWGLRSHRELRDAARLRAKGLDLSK